MTNHIQKTLSEDWLLSYAAGGLSFGHEMVIAAHLELNGKARTTYQQIEEIGGAILEDLESTEIAGSVFSSVLDKVHRTRMDETFAATKLSGLGFLPHVVASYLDKKGIDLKWKMLGPGMKRFSIWHGENDERVWLLKAKPNTSIPKHSHNGHELTLILTGKLVDNDTTFIRGDIEEADASIQHQPVVAEGEDCICLVITEGPIRLKGMFARAIQPFIGL